MSVEKFNDQASSPASEEGKKVKAMVGLFGSILRTCVERNVSQNAPGQKWLSATNQGGFTAAAAFLPHRSAAETLAAHRVCFNIPAQKQTGQIKPAIKRLPCDSRSKSASCAIISAAAQSSQPLRNYFSRYAIFAAAAQSFQLLRNHFRRCAIFAATAQSFCALRNRRTRWAIFSRHAQSSETLRNLLSDLLIP